MFMAQIERQMEEAKARYAKSASFRAELDRAIANPGRTTAVRPPAELRERIDAIAAKHGFSSIKTAVLACVIIGVKVLEGADANDRP